MDRRSPQGALAARFFERLPGRTLVPAVLIPVLVLTGVVIARSYLTPARVAVLAAGGPAEMEPGELTAAAADALDSALSALGTGIAFEVVQRSSINARPGGDPVEVPDPADPTKTVTVESIPAGTYLERGIATVAGFHAEIRRGPDDPAATPDWNGAPLELAALVRDGTTFRNDGDGWYATNRPPGIGLDPASTALLPRLLRNLVGPADAALGGPEDDPFAEIAPARKLDGEAESADAPGIIAVDLADATELVGKTELAFDDLGRLIGLRIIARNTHLDRHDLLVDTVITIRYPDQRPALPAAEPARPSDGPASGE